MKATTTPIPAARPFTFGTVDGETYYYVTDGNKNVTALLDSDGVRVAKYTYNPFGRILNSEGALAEINPFRFSSEQYDDETGLVYYNYRYYSPELGRWIKRDPIEEEGGVNLYAMVGNNPMNYWDDLGQAQVPSSQEFWSGYPNYNTYSTEAVWRKVGGNLYWSFIIRRYYNSCALRVSVGLNRTSAGKIPAGASSANKLMDFSIRRAEREEFENVRNGLVAAIFDTNTSDEDRRTYIKHNNLMVAFENEYMKNGKNKVPAGERGYFIISASSITAYYQSVWGEGETLNTKEDVERFEKCLVNQVAIFGSSGHTGVIKKGYKDPYIIAYLPVKAWKLKSDLR